MKREGKRTKRIISFLEIELIEKKTERVGEATSGQKDEKS